MIRLKLPDETYFDLPADLYWEDEFQWNPVAQLLKYGIKDENSEVSLFIHETKKKAGRPITLSSGDNSNGSFACMKRSQLLALNDLADTRPALTLLMDGRSSRSVRFRFEGGKAIEAVPLGSPYPEPPTGDDLYKVTIKLIEV
jgi:hypothetical protein